MIDFVKRVSQKPWVRFLFIFGVYALLFSLTPKYRKDAGLFPLFVSLFYPVFIGAGAGYCLSYVFPRREEKIIPSWFIEAWVKQTDSTFYMRYVQAKKALLVRVVEVIPGVVLAGFCFYLQLALAGILVYAVVLVFVFIPLFKLIKAKRVVDEDFKAMLKAWYGREKQ